MVWIETTDNLFDKEQMGFDIFDSSFLEQKLNRPRNDR